MGTNVIFEQCWRDGMRSDDRNAPNTDALQLLLGMAATPYGGVPFRQVVQPITDAALTSALITKSHPFPQLFVGKTATLLAERGDIFEVTRNGTGDWTVAALTLYDWASYNWDADTGTTGTVPASGKEWQFVDQWNEWMLFNGNCVIFKTGFSSKVFIQHGVTITTGASYQDGRIFYGGFNSSDVNALADWSTYLATLRGTVPDEELKRQSHPLDANWTWWSSIGKGDMLRFFSLPYMKFASLAATPDTSFTEANPYWRTLALRRESGRSVMPFSGTVSKMMQLGPHMMVYGSNGIHALTPVDTEHTKTFGQTEVIGFGSSGGVASSSLVRASAGGNEKIHAMVDSAGDLWFIEPNGPTARRIGYRQFFSQQSNITVSYDPHEHEFHFATTGGVGARIFDNGKGFSETNKQATTIYFGASNSVSAPIGIVLDNGVASVSFKTEWFNGNTGAESTQKPIRKVTRVSVTNAPGWTINLYYKRYPNDTARTRGGVSCDFRGMAEFSNLPGVLFQVVGFHADASVAVMPSLTVELDGGGQPDISKFIDATYA